MSSLLIISPPKRQAHCTYMQQHKAGINRNRAGLLPCSAISAASSDYNTGAASAAATSTAQDSKIILRAFVASRPPSSRAAFNVRGRRRVSLCAACSRALFCRCCCLRCAAPGWLPAACCRVAAVLLLSAVPRYRDAPARPGRRLYCYTRVVVCAEQITCATSYQCAQ